MPANLILTNTPPTNINVMCSWYNFRLGTNCDSRGSHSSIDECTWRHVPDNLNIVINYMKIFSYSSPYILFWKLFSNIFKIFSSSEAVFL